MRRWIAAALTASAVMVATPAFAQTTAKSPVDALKKQFVAGQGVKLRESTTTQLNGETYAGATREGALGFDAKGIVAAETTRTPVMPEEVRKLLEDAAEKGDDAGDIAATLLERIYLVSVGKNIYVNGGIFSTLLPDNKLWVGLPASNVAAAYGDQLINIFEPSTLKTLLATASSKRTGAYKGTISFAGLYAASPTFREMMGSKPKGKAAKTTIDWKLYLDEGQLAKRLSIKLTMPVTKKLKLSVSTETRYFDWGTPVEITAPEEHSVIKAADLLKNVPTTPAVVDRNYVSVPPDDEGKTE